MSTEERRKEIVETRTAHAKIAEMLTLGQHYSQTVTIRCTDNLEHEVAAYALSSRDIQEIFDACGLDLLQLGTSQEIPPAQRLTLMRELAIKGSHDPEILSKIAPFEEIKIANKVLEISGIAGGAKSPKPESPDS